MGGRGRVRYLHDDPNAMTHTRKTEVMKEESAGFAMVLTVVAVILTAGAVWFALSR